MKSYFENYRKTAIVKAKIFEQGDEDGMTIPKGFDMLDRMENDKYGLKQPDLVPYVATLENQKLIGEFGKHYLCIGIKSERWLVDKDIFEATYELVSAPPPSSVGIGSEPFILREFDSNKWYWCKCENCGWEDSSEFCEGGHAIADSGDYSDPLCPVCLSNKIEGEPTLTIPDTDGEYVAFIKIPIELYLAPYKKELKRLQEIQDNKYWNNFAAPSSQSPAEVDKIAKGVKLEKAIDLVQGALPYINEQLKSYQVTTLCAYIDSYLVKLTASLPSARVVEALKAYVRAQGRMLDMWSEGDDKAKVSLWKELHACEHAAREALSTVSDEQTINK